jgi:hypothetical protein
MPFELIKASWSVDDMLPEQVIRKLESLPRKILDAACKPIMKAAAQEMMVHVRAATPVYSGTLKAAMRVAAGKGGRLGVLYRVQMPTRADLQRKAGLLSKRQVSRKIAKQLGKSKRNAGMGPKKAALEAVTESGYYPAVVEYGRKKFKPFPGRKYLRGPIAAHGQTLINKAARQIAAELERIASQPSAGESGATKEAAFMGMLRENLG